jgi:hypothetical protein
MNPIQEQKNMHSAEWTWRVATRLHKQWPAVDRVDLEHVAESLQREPRWQCLAPDDAADQWLEQGIPRDAGRPVG